MGRPREQEVGRRGEADGDFRFRIRSDDLVHLRPVLDHLHEQTHGLIPRLPRLYLVIDANMIYRELKSIVVKRRKLGSRTNLQEVIASGIPTLFAPLELDAEVERRCQQLAEETGCPLADFRSAWTAYRATMFVCRADEVTSDSARALRERYANDLPYLFLSASVSADAILTFDRDLRDTTGIAADAIAIADLRDFVRYKSVQVTLSIGSAAGVGMFFKALYEIGRFLIHSPWGLLLFLALGTVGWLVNRTQRASGGAGWFRHAWEVLKDLVLRLVRRLRGATRLVRRKWKAVMRAMPGGRRRTLRHFVFAVLAISRKPLLVVDIIRRVLAEGHRTRAKSLRPQVRRILKTDVRFEERPNGWSLAAMWAAQ